MKMRQIPFAMVAALGMTIMAIADNEPTDHLNRAKEEQGTVLSQGDEVRATTQEGTMVIRAENEHERSFEWNGVKQVAEMRPRAEPWNGHLGIYNPGESGMWKDTDGVSRVVYDEYCLPFPTKEDAEKYLKKWYGGSADHYVSDKEQEPAGVWNNSGLVVWWKRSRWAKALNVVVIQITIDGKKPVTLAGNHDSMLIFRR
jgi:hypothetical protein